MRAKATTQKEIRRDRPASLRRPLTDRRSGVTQRPVRVFIWGSCVSRDAMEFMPQARVVQYVARQSVISGSNEATDVVGEPLVSPFQQRMADWDRVGRGPRLLGELVPDSDLVLMDLCDERFGVYEVSPGVFVTRSVERMAQGTDDAWNENYRLIPFGCDEHFDLWAASMTQVLRRLRQLRRSHLLRVVALPWATLDTAGNPTPHSGELDAVDANLLNVRYLEWLERAGVRLVGLETPAVADPEHKWGRAPFHYTRGVYEALVAEITASFPDSP